ncbi:MAG: biotin/lipoyl-containing protein, partial [Pyrinomonadaceae bacterium]
MSVEVVMPQMGEFITEGTVSKWLKAVGEKVEKDELLLEISTDKVDAEVPSPGAGILLEIRANEGETVEVGSVIGVVGEASEQPAAVQSSEFGVQSRTEQPKAETAPPVVEEKIETNAADAQAQTAEATAEINANPENSGDAAEVVMPQMGESITEGTVSKWLKAVGDKIEKDEPLLEISTDKVDAEVPSPVAGTLLEIRANEGETVEVGSIVGFVGAQGAAGVQSQTAASAQKQAVEKTAQATGADVAAQAQAARQTVSMPPEEKREIQEIEGRSYDYGRPNAVEDAEKSFNRQSNGRSNGKSNGEMSLEDLRRTKSSPLVRNIAKEHHIDISKINGSGMSGRVTKKDILDFIDSGASFKPEDLLVKTLPAVSKTAAPQVQTAATYTTPAIAAGAADRVEPMSVMRKKIAEHMTFSKQTSAHVTS